MSRPMKSDAPVLEYLTREADLDGLVTVNLSDIARGTGCAGPTVARALDVLEGRGLLTRGSAVFVADPDGAHRGRQYFEVQLADEVLDA